MSLSFICLASLFFLRPCLSSSCPQLPQPHELPCNKSIQIKPPFFLTNSSRDLCEDKINIKCDSHNSSRIYPFQLPNIWLYLENILYAPDLPNQFIVRDPTLETSLYLSNCGNLKLSFLTQSRENFDYGQYTSISSNIISFCNSSKLSYHPIFDREYTLNYSATTEEYLPTNCYIKVPNASFECTFSFDADGNVFLLSAQYSNNLCSQQGCFKQSLFEGKTSKTAWKKKLVGVIVGITGLLIVCFLFLFLHKHKKLTYLSSPSKFLTQRTISDRYLHEMAGLQYTQIFSNEELEEATEGFNASKELGDGGFGTVYKGKLRDGRVVAVKRLYKNSYKSIEQFINEVEILSRIHHPNLVTLYGCTAHTSRDLLLVFEFVSNGTIADHLHGPRSSENILTWPIRLSIAIETADALAYLHAVDPQIIHRDVKTNNILLDDGLHVKVGDFGLSRLFPLNVTHVSTVPQGTPGYVDPVYYQCYQLTDKSDVYSFGVVLVELISSKPAVDIARSRDEINLANLALKLIQRDELDDLADPALGFQSDPEVRKMVALVAELAFRCLQSDRDMRPSIKEVLEVLTVIQNGGYNTEQIAEIGVRKEEADLLETQAIDSPMTVMTGWMSQSTTPNTSNSFTSMYQMQLKF